MSGKPWSTNLSHHSSGFFSLTVKDVFVKMWQLVYFYSCKSEWDLGNVCQRSSHAAARACVVVILICYSLITGTDLKNQWPTSDVLIHKPIKALKQLLGLSHFSKKRKNKAYFFKKLYLREKNALYKVENVFNRMIMVKLFSSFFIQFLFYLRFCVA